MSFLRKDGVDVRYNMLLESTGKTFIMVERGRKRRALGLLGWETVENDDPTDKKTADISSEIV